MSVSVSVSVSVAVSVSVSVSMSTCVCICFCVHVYLNVFQREYVCLCTRAPTFVCVRLCDCKYVCMYVCMFVVCMNEELFWFVWCILITIMTVSLCV